MQPKQIDAFTMSVRRNMTEKQIIDILETKFIICTVRSVHIGKMKRGFKLATVHINQWSTSSYYSNDNIRTLIDNLYNHRQARFYYDINRYWNIKVDENYMLNAMNLWVLQSRVAKLEYDLQNANHAYNAKEAECAKLASFESSPLHRTANSDETYVWHSLIRHLKENSNEYPVDKLQELFNTLKSVLNPRDDKRLTEVTELIEAAKKRNESIKAFVEQYICEENEVIDYDDDSTIVDEAEDEAEHEAEIEDVSEDEAEDDGEIVSETASQREEYVLVDEFSEIPNPDNNNLVPFNVPPRRVTRSMTRYKHC